MQTRNISTLFHKSSIYNLTIALIDYSEKMRFIRVKRSCLKSAPEPGIDGVSHAVPNHVKGIHHNNYSYARRSRK